MVVKLLDGMDIVCFCHTFLNFVSSYNELILLYQENILYNKGLEK